MKTKILLSILVALPLVAGLTGCKSDDETTARPAKERLMVVGGNIVQFRANETGPTSEVNISADCRWTVNVDAGTFGDDLSVSPRQGNGNGSLTIVSNQNTDANVSRDATITITSDGGLRQVISVKQTAGDDAMNISTDRIKFTAEDTKIEPLEISSNVSWTVTRGPSSDWVHFVDKDGNQISGGNSGTTSLYISVDKSTTDIERTGYLVLSYSGKSVNVEVVQDGMTNVSLSVPSDDIRWSYTPSESTIRVVSNAEWKAYIPSTATWLHFADSVGGSSHTITGVGNGEIRIRCEENNTTHDRMSAVIIIAGTKNPQQATVVVEQEANSPVAETSVSELTSMYVGDVYADFHFSFVSDEEVSEFGLVYSASNTTPTISDGNVKVGNGGYTRNVLGSLNNLESSTTYYVRAYVVSATGQYIYSPNMVTITTSSSSTVPGESDNPDPRLAPRQ